jgi:hypothetical protein
MKIMQAIPANIKRLNNASIVDRGNYSHRTAPEDETCLVTGMFNLSTNNVSSNLQQFENSRRASIT